MKTTPTTLTRGGHDASVTVTSQTIPTVNRKFDFQDAFNPSSNSKSSSTHLNSLQAIEKSR